ncbi:MAG: acylphosphatase, partial [Thermoguttaceae bacterium]|nr:acylphosphatase [Thermoguttaceae bacterium]
MNQPVATLQTVERLSITVRGVVQGVGFRPFVFNAARRLNLAGWV